MPNVENELIATLSDRCRAFLEPILLTKPINSGETLYVRDSPVQSLIFPNDGIISLQGRLKDRRSVEKMAIGRDGVVGFETFLDLSRSQCDAVVVVSGSASWLSVHDFQAARETYPCMDRALKMFIARSLKRVTQSVVCASVHPAAQRVASWLLHANDMVISQDFDLTQRSMADLLGLRLATVSDACGKLATAGAIQYSRGMLTVLDRATLAGQACECYEAGR